jgi:plastocyanin
MLCALLAIFVVSDSAAAAVGRHASRAKHSTHKSACSRRHKGHRARHCRKRKIGLDKPSRAASPATPSLVAVPPSPPASASVAPAAPFVSPLPAIVALPEGEAGNPGEVAEPGEPPVLPHVQVSAVEYAFTLSRTTVPAGKVVLQFVNDGQDEHNLKVAPAEGPLAGSFETVPAKAVSNLTVELRPGSYTLFCSLPTHEQKGMKATLTVE